MEHNIYFYSANFQTALWFYVNANISCTSHIQNSIYWLGFQASVQFTRHWINIFAHKGPLIWFNIYFQDKYRFSKLSILQLLVWAFFGTLSNNLWCQAICDIGAQMGQYHFFGWINNFYVQSASYLPFYRVQCFFLSYQHVSIMSFTDFPLHKQRTLPWDQNSLLTVPEEHFSME